MNDRERNERIRNGTMPIIITQPLGLEKTQTDLMEAVIHAYDSPSSRWNRNYTKRAEWYFMWHCTKLIMSSTPQTKEGFFFKQWSRS